MSAGPKADVWMPLYVADYARDTFHLTRDQHGGYFLLLMACWGGGGRLPNNPGALAAITKSTPQEWAKLKRVLLPFFRVQGDHLVHKRVLAEWEKAARLSATRQAAGALGGRPKKQTETKPKPIGSENHNQTESKPKHLQEGDGDGSKAVDTSPPSQEVALGDPRDSSTACVIPLAGWGSA